MIDGKSAFYELLKVFAVFAVREENRESGVRPDELYAAIVPTGGPLEYNSPNPRFDEPPPPPPIKSACRDDID